MTLQDYLAAKAQERAAAAQPSADAAAAQVPAATVTDATRA